MIDVTGKRVLIVGDSLTHRGQTNDPIAVNVTQGILRISAAPGDLLASQALAAGASAARINGRVGRSAWSFYTKEDASAILKAELKWKPDIVVIMLGTNDLGLTAESNARYFSRLRTAFAAGGAEVWGLGPPAFAKLERQTRSDIMVVTLRKVFGSHFLDIRPFTDPSFGRTDDGVHFVPIGAQFAASKIAANLFAASKHSTTTPAPATTAALVQLPTSRAPLLLGATAVTLGLVGLFFVLRGR